MHGGKHVKQNAVCNKLHEHPVEGLKHDGEVLFGAEAMKDFPLSGTALSIAGTAHVQQPRSILAYLI